MRGELTLQRVKLLAFTCYIVPLPEEFDLIIGIDGLIGMA